VDKRATAVIIKLLIAIVWILSKREDTEWEVIDRCLKEAASVVRGYEMNLWSD
jgi:hypothetical protein